MCKVHDNLLRWLLNDQRCVYFWYRNISERLTGKQTSPRAEIGVWHIDGGMIHLMASLVWVVGGI